MSDSEKQLWNAVLEHPDDDAPRLAYARWLSARGDARGEFIALQCEVEHLAAGAERNARSARADVLLREHYASWVGPFAWNAPRFRRGFVTEAKFGSVPEKGFEPFFAIAPIEHVILPLEVLVALGDTPYIERIRSFELTDATSLHPLGDQGAERIAQLRLTGLRSLDLCYKALGDAGIVALARSPHLRSLRDIELTNNIGIRDTAVVELAASPMLDTVARFRAAGCSIGDAGLRALSASTHLGRLVRLDLANNPIGAAGLDALLHSERLGSLRELIVSNCKVGDAGAAILASAPLSKQLHHIGLSFSGVSDEGAVALARSSNVSALETIEIHSNPIAVRGVRALRGSLHRALRDAGSLLAPRFVEEMPFAPTRPRRDEAVKIAAATMRGDEAWNALIAAGLVSQHFDRSDSRHYLEEIFEVCSSCNGTGTDPYASVCYACSHGGRVLVGHKRHPMPPTVASAVLLAADGASLETVETLGRTMASRLSAWDVPAVREVEWLVEAPASALAWGVVPEAFVGVLKALRDAVPEPTIPVAGHCLEWATIGEAYWNEVSAEQFAGRENPFEPLQAIRRLGYRPTLVGGVLRIACVQ